MSIANKLLAEVLKDLGKSTVSSVSLNRITRSALPNAQAVSRITGGRLPTPTNVSRITGNKIPEALKQSAKSSITEQLNKSKTSERVKNGNELYFEYKLKRFRESKLLITDRWLKNNLRPDINYVKFKPFFDNYVRGEEMVLNTAIRLSRDEKTLQGLALSIKKLSSSANDMLNKATKEWDTMMEPVYEIEDGASPDNAYYDDPRFK